MNLLYKIGSVETNDASDSFVAMSGTNSTMYKMYHKTKYLDPVDEVIVSLTWNGYWPLQSSTLKMCYALRYILQWWWCEWLMHLRAVQSSAKVTSHQTCRWKYLFFSAYDQCFISWTLFIESISWQSHLCLCIIKCFMSSYIQSLFIALLYISQLCIPIYSKPLWCP